MTAQKLTPAVLAALPVAQVAAASTSSPYGQVDTIVRALDRAGLLVDPGGPRTVAAPGCGVSGCGSTSAYLDTGTDRTAGWTKVHVKGTPILSARWYCTARCAAAAPAGPVYLAVSQGLVLDGYTAHDAAASHCETQLRSLTPAVSSSWWPEADNPTVTVLGVEDGGRDVESGFQVVALFPKASYVPVEANE